MTSVLNVDTIADKAGTGPVALTKQNAAKTWFVYDQNSNVTDSSFSTSSISDNATGQFTSNFTNTFSTKPCPAGMASYYSYFNTRNPSSVDGITTIDTDFNVANSSVTDTDRQELSVSFNGDLA